MDKQMTIYTGESWPNWQTVMSSLSVTDNVVCEIFKSSYKTTLITNSVIRAASIKKALYDKKYYKVIFDVTALFLLFFPYGRLAAIGVDLASEIYNFYHFSNKRKPPSPFDKATVLTNRLDPSVPENALIMLGIPKEKENDLEFIKTQYETFVNDLKNKINKGLSKPFIREFEFMIAESDAAYATLTRKKIS